MTYSTTTKKSKGRSKKVRETLSIQEVISVQAALDFFQNPDMRILLKVGGGLWLFIGVCAVLGWVSMKPAETNLLQASQNLELRQLPQMRLINANKSNWRPGQHASGECGALQDSNMRRLGSSATIQQFVDDAPPGYETPYRVQKY
jgi:hypothetical protein